MQSTAIVETGEELGVWGKKVTAQRTDNAAKKLRVTIIWKKYRKQLWEHFGNRDKKSWEHFGNNGG